eukprot:528079_1
MDYAFWEEEEEEGMGPNNEPVTQPFELTQVEKYKHVCLECGSSDVVDDEGEVPVCAHCGAVYTGQIDEMVEYNELHRGMTRTRQIRRKVPSAGNCDLSIYLPILSLSSSFRTLPCGCRNQ